MTLLATIKQAATNNVTAGVTSAGGATFGGVVWVTNNITLLTLIPTFGMFCIAGFTAYSSWHFKNIEKLRKDRQEQRELDMRDKIMTSRDERINNGPDTD